MVSALKTASILMLEGQPLANNTVISLAKTASTTTGTQLVSQLATSLTNILLKEVSKLVFILALPTSIFTGMGHVRQTVLIPMLEDTKLTETIVMNLVLTIPTTSTTTLAALSVILLSKQTILQLNGLVTFLVTLPQCYIGIILVLNVISLCCLLKLTISNTVTILVSMAHISTGTLPAPLFVLILLSRALSRVNFSVTRLAHLINTSIGIFPALQFVIHRTSLEQKHNSSSVISLAQVQTQFYIGMVSAAPLVTILSPVESILSANPSVTILAMMASTSISTRPVVPVALFLIKLPLSTVVASSATILVLRLSSLLGMVLVLLLVVILIFRPLFKEDYIATSRARTRNMLTGMERATLLAQHP